MVIFVDDGDGRPQHTLNFLTSTTAFHRFELLGGIFKLVLWPRRLQ